MRERANPQVCIYVGCCKVPFDCLPINIKDLKESKYLAAFQIDLVLSILLKGIVLARVDQE